MGGRGPETCGARVPEKYSPFFPARQSPGPLAAFLGGCGAFWRRWHGLEPGEKAGVFWAILASYFGNPGVGRGLVSKTQNPKHKTQNDPGTPPAREGLVSKTQNPKPKTQNQNAWCLVIPGDPWARIGARSWGAWENLKPKPRKTPRFMENP